MPTDRTVVLLHGVPETVAIWQPLISALEQRGTSKVIALSPPGFGAAIPPGFEPSMKAYVHWLSGELESIGGDIDLVGHDWGAGHLYGLLADRPDLLRTWVGDVAGIIHRDYVWHDMAQAWQTPEIGEQVIGGMTGGSPEERAALFVGLGLPENIANDLAAGLDENMGRCILALYRDAAQPAVGDLGDRAAALDLPPGLAINATADEYIPTEQTLEMAARLGADVLTLDGRGHWWMTEDVDAVADSLIAFWSAN